MRPILTQKGRYSDLTEFKTIGRRLTIETNRLLWHETFRKKPLIPALAYVSNVRANSQVGLFWLNISAQINRQRVIVYILGLNVKHTHRQCSEIIYKIVKMFDRTILYIGFKSLSTVQIDIYLIGKETIEIHV